MNNIINAQLITAILSVTSLLGTGAAAAEKLPQLIMAKSNKVRFEHVVMELQGQHYVLSGKIRRKSYNSQVAPGHIDYAAFDNEDNLITEGAVRYSPSLSLRRWKHGSTFSIKLPTSVTETATIRISFHKSSTPKESEYPLVIH